MKHKTSLALVNGHSQTLFTCVGSHNDVIEQLSVDYTSLDRCYTTPVRFICGLPLVIISQSSSPAADISLLSPPFGFVRLFLHRFLPFVQSFRLLPIVCAAVYTKVTLSNECFSADVTTIGPCVCVSLMMNS